VRIEIFTSAIMTNIAWEDTPRSLTDPDLYFRRTYCLCWMPSSWLLCRVAVTRTDDSEEHMASIIRVAENSELGALAVNSNRRILWRHYLLFTVNVVPSKPILVKLMMGTVQSPSNVGSKTIWRNIPEDAILHSHCRENLKILHSLKLLGFVGEK
jgi:hypothetical protein